MKVKELIELLRQENPEAEVKVRYADHHGWEWEDADWVNGTERDVRIG